jgi:hypothetical protein
MAEVTNEPIHEALKPIQDRVASLERESDDRIERRLEIAQVS